MGTDLGTSTMGPTISRRRRDAKDHEADRWIAAVSIAGDLPLATEDSIFDDVPDLALLRP